MLFLTFSRSSFPWSWDLTNSSFSVRNPTYKRSRRVRDAPFCPQITASCGFLYTCKELCTCFSLSLSFLSVFSWTSCRCSTFLSISSLCSLMTTSSCPSCKWNKHVFTNILSVYTLKALKKSNSLQIASRGAICWTWGEINFFKKETKNKHKRGTFINLKGNPDLIFT